MSLDGTKIKLQIFGICVSLSYEAGAVDGLCDGFELWCLSLTASAGIV